METNIKNIRYQLTLTLFFSWLVGYCDKTAINVASIPIGKEFHVNSTQIGLVMSSFFLSYTFMNLVGGYLADKLGARIVVTTIMVLWSISTAVTGLAWSLMSLIVIRFIFGLCEGAFPSASSVLIADIFEKKHRGRAKSFIVSASSLGTAVGTVIVSALSVKFGWRSAFWSFGVIGAILAVTFILLFKKAQSQSNAVKNNTDEQSVKKVPVKNVLKLPLVWKLAVMEFGFGVFWWGMNSWMPTYWVKVKHMNMMSMGILQAVPPLVAFAAMNFSGWFIDKYLVKKEKNLICICTFIGAIFVFFTYKAPNIPLGFTCLTISTTALGMVSPTIFVLALKYIQKECVGTVTGIANFGQQMAGVLSPAIMGYLITVSHGSYTVIFISVIIAAALTFVVGLSVNVDKDSAMNS